MNRDLLNQAEVIVEKLSSDQIFDLMGIPTRGFFRKPKKLLDLDLIVWFSESDRCKTYRFTELGKAVVFVIARKYYFQYRELKASNFPKPKKKT